MMYYKKGPILDIVKRDQIRTIGVVFSIVDIQQKRYYLIRIVFNLTKEKNENERHF